ncbi:hypothetical protein [Clostridium sp. MCC353]|nr:hypothetical protein [Clostridium sp. MCC353]
MSFKAARLFRNTFIITVLLVISCMVLGQMAETVVFEWFGFMK